MTRPQAVELPRHEFLSQLARDDPPAYEALRHELIDRFIEGVPERYKFRLRGLQFRIDLERRLSRSALGATLKIQALMWESFLRLNDELQGLAHPIPVHPDRRSSTSVEDASAGKGAQILDFQPRERREQS